MYYLVFNRNLYNSLVVGGFRNVLLCTKDSSIFRIEEGEFFSYIEGDDFASSCRSTLGSDSLTILYSFCPVEICGLYDTVNFLSQKCSPSIYVSRPKVQSVGKDVVSYSDCSPQSIPSLIKSNYIRLNSNDIKRISDSWNEIIRTQTNLRIWHENRVQNVEDSFFDADIKEVLTKQGTSDRNKLLIGIQLLLRERHHLGLNPKYIAWRVSSLLE